MTALVHKNARRPQDIRPARLHAHDAAIERMLRLRQQVPDIAGYRHGHDRDGHTGLRDAGLCGQVHAQPVPHEASGEIFHMSRSVAVEGRYVGSSDDHSFRIEQFHHSIPTCPGCYMLPPGHRNLAPPQANSTLRILTEVETGDNGTCCGNLLTWSQPVYADQISEPLEPSTEPSLACKAAAASTGHSRIATQVGTPTPLKRAIETLSPPARITSQDRNSITVTGRVFHVRRAAA